MLLNITVDDITIHSNAAPTIAGCFLIISFEDNRNLEQFYSITLSGT